MWKSQSDSVEGQGFGKRNTTNRETTASLEGTTQLDLQSHLRSAVYVAYVLICNSLAWWLLLRDFFVKHGEELNTAVCSPSRLVLEVHTHTISKDDSGLNKHENFLQLQERLVERSLLVLIYSYPLVTSVTSFVRTLQP